MSNSPYSTDEVAPTPCAKAGACCSPKACPASAASSSAAPSTPALPTGPAPLATSVQSWLDHTRARLDAGEQLSPQDLDTLQGILRKPTQVRQRLLYMHLTTPVPQAQAIACVIFEPVANAGGNEILADDPVLPYHSASAAIADGWQVLAVPDLNAPIDDHEVDMLGYLFVLQKLEVFHD